MKKFGLVVVESKEVGCSRSRGLCRIAEKGEEDEENKNGKQAT